MFTAASRRTESRRPTRTAIVSRLNVGSHAGQKAPHDVRTIAMTAFGAVPLDLAPYNSTSALTRVVSSVLAAGKLVRAIPRIRRMDVVISQHPLGKLNDLVLVALARNVPSITVIHDLEMLRWSKHSLRETQRLALSTVLIAPTAAMAEYILAASPNSRLIDLQRFDYLVTEPLTLEPASSRPSRLILAGSLDPAKAPWLYEVKDLVLPLDLYGPACEVDRLQHGVHYRGIIATAYPALNERNGFGLVWDGASGEQLAGPTGRYLRYNAPHKFSLYMALGLPVLVSRQSALAALVQENGLGLLIDDVPSGAAAVAALPPRQWKEMTQNVESYRRGLLRGDATRSVLLRALETVNAANAASALQSPAT